MRRVAFWQLVLLTLSLSECFFFPFISNKYNEAKQLRVQSSAGPFAIRFDWNLFGSPNLDTSIRPQLVGVCMQSVPTLTVYTLYAGSIHLV